jgi:hypothetical protein
MYKHLIGLSRLQTVGRLKKENSNRKLDNLDVLSIDSVGSYNALGQQLDGVKHGEFFSYIPSESNENVLNLSNEELNEKMTDSIRYSDKLTVKEENKNEVVINRFVSDYGDEDDEDEEDIVDELTRNINELNKTSSSVRLDLINEIKDEFLDDSATGGNVSNDNSLNDAHKEVNSENDEEDDNEDNEDFFSEEKTVNLNNMRICIDEIEELTDKANKTCFVFVVQVWDLQSTLEAINLANSSAHDQHHHKSKLASTSSISSNTSNDTSSNNKQDKEKTIAGISQSPSWCVKRKYDEFYVLDSRLKEFHGGILSINESNIQLPPKQRFLFFGSSSAKNLEYLYSIKNDFARYLQVMQFVFYY